MLFVYHHNQETGQHLQAFYSVHIKLQTPDLSFNIHYYKGKCQITSRSILFTPKVNQIHITHFCKYYLPSESVYTHRPIPVCLEMLEKYKSSQD
jgi:hypothetical protein